MFDKNFEKCHLINPEQMNVYENCLELGLTGDTCDACNLHYYGIIQIAEDKFGCDQFLDKTHKCDVIYRENIPETLIADEVGKGKPQCKTCETGFSLTASNTYCHLNNCKNSTAIKGHCSVCEENFKLAFPAADSKKDEANKKCATLQGDRNITEGGAWLKHCETIQFNRNAEEGKNQFKCLKCKEDSGMKVDELNDSLCTLNAVIEADENTNIEHCEIYKMEGNEKNRYICDKCVINYKLETEEGTSCILAKVNNCDEEHQNLVEGTCTLCKEDYFLSEDLKSCVLKETFPGCIKANNLADARDCIECEESLAIHFDNANNKNICQTMNILNCAQPENAIANLLEGNKSIQHCKRCGVNFFQSETKTDCLAGNVPECYYMKKNSPYQCHTCKDQFLLVKIDEVIDTCVYMTQHLNCKKPIFQGVQTETVNEVSHKRLKITCGDNESTSESVCPEKHTLTTLDSKQTKQQCKQLDLIPNCKTYDYQDPVLKCRMCRTNFWLDVKANQCNQITPRDNCLIYEAESDLCSTCAETHILSTNQESCIIIPDGEINCEVYDNTGKVCLKCKPGNYLLEGECKFTDIVPDCSYYLHPNQCETCANNY